MDKMAGLNFIFIRDAAKAPVHAPVPGRGIPTNMISPIFLYFSIWDILLLPFSSSLSTSLTSFVLRIQSKIFLIKRRIKGIGRMVPAAQIRKAGMRSSPNTLAAKIPPRSSTRGIILIINTVNSAGMVLEKNSSNISVILKSVDQRAGYILRPSQKGMVFPFYFYLCYYTLNFKIKQYLLENFVDSAESIPHFLIFCDKFL